MLYGVPVGATFEEYTNNRSSFAEQSGLAISGQTALWLVMSDLGSDSAKLVAECIHSLSKETRISIFPGIVTQCGAAIVIEYDKGRFGPSDVDIKLQSVPPSAAQQMNIPATTVKEGGTVTGLISRPTSGDVLLSVNVPNLSLSDDIVVPAPAPPLAEYPAVERKSEITGVNFDRGNSSGEIIFNTNEDEIIVGAERKIDQLIGVVVKSPLIISQDRKTASYSCGAQSWKDGNGNWKNSSGLFYIDAEMRSTKPLSAPAVCK